MFDKNTKEEDKSFLRKVFDYIVDLWADAVVIILLVVIVRYFVISPFQVNGGSMNNTFYHWDYIFVEKLSYTFSKPDFLDIVIFIPPKDSTAYRVRHVTWVKCVIAHLNKLSFASDICIDNPDFFIKRVLWIPWDVISVKDWVVYRNWEILNENNYLNENNNWKTFLPSFQDAEEFIVPEDSVFVLWDNRNWSSDSRYWKDQEWDNRSFVNYSDIEWKFFFRLFSPHNILN